MKFIANKNELNKALSIVANTATAKQMPILDCVLISVGDNRVKLTTTTLETTTIVTLGGQSVDAHVDGSVAVNLKDLTNFCKRAGDAEISFSLEDTKLEVVSGKYKADLFTLHADEFPTIDTDSDNANIVFGVDAKPFIETVDRVFRCISTDIARPHLAGANLKVVDSKLTLEATDGHRLAVSNMKCHVTKETKQDAIVPREALKAFRDLAVGCYGLNISVDSGSVYARSVGYGVDGDEVIVMSRLIDGSFPKVSQVIPDVENRGWDCYTIDKADLREKVLNVTPFANNRTTHIKFDMGISTVIHTMSDAGYCQEIVQTDCDKEMTFGLNGKYLIDAIDSIPDDFVCMYVSNDSVRPIPIFGAIDGIVDREHITIVMPMRA